MWLLRCKFLVAFFGFAALVLFLIQVLEGEKGGGGDSGYTVPKIVSFGFVVKNNTGKVAENIDFWAYAPVKVTSFQKVETLEVSYPFSLIVDDFGNQIMHIHFDFIPPYSEKNIYVQANLLMANTPQHVQLSNSSSYLADELKIQVSHPDIQKKAASFHAKSISDIESIYRWVSSYIKPLVYVEENKGALYALNKQEGDCTEYASLMTAILRAKGVPTRIVGGFVLSNSGKLQASAFHNWAEFYYEDSWHLVDPQVKVFEDRVSDYVIMNIISDNINSPMGDYQRFRFTGEGVNATLL